MAVKDRGPAVNFPPPIFMLLVIGSAELINRFGYQLSLDFHNLPMAIGSYLFATAIVAAAAIGFRRHQTNITPFTPDSQLIENGIFRFSRNPIYVSFFIYQIMFGFIFHNWWQICLLPVSWLYLRFYVIAKEEAYLQQLFGQPYLQYQLRVRRWI